ncbi:hypothetical protein MHU86_14995 [Fragilaria crotonensis]|nr:hypothetical protein MHU86_14995 [Fragilaria crotonensis]
MSIDQQHACPLQCLGQRPPTKDLKTKHGLDSQPLPKHSNDSGKGTSEATIFDTQTHGEHPYHPPTIAATQQPSLSAYLQSLSTWYQRLLSHYVQDATDLDIWRTFRSRRRITIATDGSLLPSAETFGWKITTSQHTVLFHGSGPIDGPIEIGSSTRSKLGGFTAPLLLVTILARYWGLRHRCKFRWLVDSRIAINRVTFVTRKDHRPTRQPDNNDYLAVIQELHAELRRPIRAVWIKSHQDDSKDYGKLSADAKPNADADALATAFHRRTRSNAMRSTAHLPCTKISISINKVRYYGNMDNNL